MKNVYDLILHFQRVFSPGEKAVSSGSVSSTSLSQISENSE